MPQGKSKQVLTALGIVLTVVALVFGLVKLNPQSNPETTTRNLSSDQSIPVQKMSVAGTFYPADRENLDSQLDSLLNIVEEKEQTEPIQVLVVPHAGLDYSGQVAASGFKQIIDSGVERVIILAAAHFHRPEKPAIVSAGKWETPLGEVEIDENLARKISGEGNLFVNDGKLFDKEHPIEIQVVWIKKVLPQAKIVPILLGTTDEITIKALAYRMAQNWDEKTLLIVSTDLSHYPDYETAKKTDEETIKAILTGKTEEILASKAGVETTSCGLDGLKIAQKITQLLGWNQPQLLKYLNSGDVTGDKTRVVGYAAVETTGKNTLLSVEQLSQSAREEALSIAKVTLESFVKDKKVPEFNNVASLELDEPLGAFVTLEKNGQLRGCIGEFEPIKPLWKVIRDKTIAAASQDTRFSPVTKDELEQIKIEVSVMSPRRKIDDWAKIIPGTDGVVIIAGNRGGTFLPQVATDNSWGLEEFLSQLCTQKAGLPGECYKDPQTEIYTYQAQVFE